MVMQVMQHISSRAEIKEKFSGASCITLACWLISSLIAIIVPASKWARERNEYYKYMGQYNEYESKQQQYKQMKSGNGNWTGSNAAMKFVYAWNIIMFIGLTIHRYRILANGKDQMGIIIALLIYAQFSLMNLITTTQGAIETDDHFFENSIYGWFGQYSVLVAYTDFWMFLCSMIFPKVLGAIQYRNRSQKEESVADVSDSLAVYKQDGPSFDEVLTQCKETD
ncbi:hypothetical protein HJC23_013474 [Cyclotella cryptica]|uniref:Uncharacterized protein n=1 Tax=Cyclotella cryptica TaxID=29204 RepID=A0ABD3QC20_9STRA